MENLLNPGVTIFGFTIYYYAIAIVIGMIVATCLSALLMKRRNMSPDFIFTLFIFCIPSALICARLYYCITEPLPFDKWIDVRDGGLSILGGVIGGVGMGLVVCLVKKINFFRAADCVVITILIAQVIGRWGNFFNQEVYGFEVTDPAQQWFPLAVFIDKTQSWHYALFFYEGCLNAIGFALLYTAAWFWTKRPNGIFTFAYFVWYGIVRAIMEPFRDPQYILGAGVDAMWSQLTSVLMIGMGIIGILALLIYNVKTQGAVFGSRTGDPCGISDYIGAYKNDKPYFSKINILGAKYPLKPEEKPKKKSREDRMYEQFREELSLPEYSVKDTEEKKEDEDGEKKE